jgi:hypothetical protein
MRYALRGITPDVILERRRKAFVIQGLLSTLASNYGMLSVLCADAFTVRSGLCSRESLQHHLEEIVRRDCRTWLLPLQRWIAFELWIKALQSASALAMQCLH